jgi:phosphatidate cytidylyltransferase
MLKTRVIVAIIALPILIALIVVGGWPFALVLTAALLLAGDEYVRLVRQGSYHPPEWLVLALIALPLAATWFAHDTWRAPGLAAALIVGALKLVWDYERRRPNAMLNVALALFGGVYIGWLGSSLLAVRMLDDGAYLTLVVYGCVIVSDSAAYFVGRQWGRHKMSPRVSPKKSWEGYAGSVVSGAVFGALAGGLPDIGALNALHGAILGLLIGVLGTAGDLAISAIKRQVNAKDSSHLIPGHGGLLDRVDSVLIAAALSYYYFDWFVL